MRRNGLGPSLLVSIITTLGVAWSAEPATAQTEAPPEPKRPAPAESPNTPPLPPSDADNPDANYSYFVERSQKKDGIQLDEWWQLEKTAAGLERRKDYERQLQLLKIELQVFEREFGTDALECVNVLEQLVECCKKFDRQIECKAFQQKMAQILSKGKSKIEGATPTKQTKSDPYSGVDNNQVVSSLVARGEIYAKRNDQKTAIKYFKKALSEVDKPLTGAFEEIANEKTKSVMRRQAEDARKSLRICALKKLAHIHSELHESADAIAAYESLLPLVRQNERTQIEKQIEACRRQ